MGVGQRSAARGSVGFSLLVAVLAAGCAVENKHDIHMQGLQIEREAREGPCRLLYDPSAGTHVLTGDRVQSCLGMVERALVLYDRAAALGLRDYDFTRTHERCMADAERLRNMLKEVRRMELGLP
jgi:hypothetical protein